MCPYSDIHPSFSSIFLYTVVYVYLLISLCAFCKNYRATGMSEWHELDFHLLFRLIMIERGEEQ